jgi:peptidoglycan/LPS O-acetylase OafA/YrhL
MTFVNHRPSLVFRSDINAMRAIAVISVIGFHTFPKIVPGGFTGVDIFFVISGFLISSIIFEGIDAQPFSFMDFYHRRIKRILPALLFVLAATYLMGWFLLLPIEFKNLGKHVLSAASFVTNFTLLGESGYFDAAAETKPLLHLWSLGIEEQFYILWPLYILICTKLRLNRYYFIAVPLIASFAINVALVERYPAFAFYAPFSRFWELLVGSILACVQEGNGKRRTVSGLPQNVKSNSNSMLPPLLKSRLVREFLVLCGISLIASGFFLVSKGYEFPGFWALLPVMGSALLIASGTQGTLANWFFSNRFLGWFGTISYPLYLWHWPLLTYARTVQNGPPSNSVLIALVALSVLLAWLTYEFLEKKILMAVFTQVRIGSVLALLFVFGLTGLATFQFDGFHFRFSKFVLDLTDFSYDYSADYRSGSCFLLAEQTSSDFLQCPTSNDQNRKTIFIWGDSHAAHLYVGLHDRYGDQFNIEQKTASGCPPIMDLEISDRPSCKEINDYILRRISDSKPDRIVLAGRWVMYDWQRIDDTINKLRALGISKIDLVGPDPWWKNGLPRQLYSAYQGNRFSPIPSRMRSGLNESFETVDLNMAQQFSKKVTNYISLRSILCDKDGCLTQVDNSDNKLIAWDYGHFTKAGSDYVVSKFPQY